MNPLAVSCGEPAGIGPEIAAKAWHALKETLPFFYIGDPRHLPEGTPYGVVKSSAEAAQTCAEALPVMAMDFGPAASPGQAQAAHAPHVIEAIRLGARMAMAASGWQASGLVTAPINKAALIKGAGFAYPGHTEFLAHLAGVDHVVMMLACAALRAVPATIHIPLSDVPQVLTPALLERVIRITDHALRHQFGISAPRLAIAGLNPHAGEEGLMGTEELEWIAPLLEHLRGDGLELTGPMPADTMFHAQAREGYDVAIAMYHDQALIPVKTLDFSGGVNVTLGLPFIRTSPDHGTAFNIAGTGKAEATSMIAALKMAAQMAKSTQPEQNGAG
ncbi:MAG: 4-hydroxythreonine-4-phosphate dehydrogenase PdxA [Rhodobacteraceae bacterium]|nr:4-hydroxythreonine-4-phosphate dehydrogenase PdxA [Paracoccaceae bacterium]